MKDVIAASMPFPMPAPPPPPGPPPPGATTVPVTTNASCVGGGTMREVWCVWSSKADATTGMGSGTYAVTFAACKTAASTYDGTLSISISVSGSSTTTNGTTAAAVLLTFSYDGGPLQVTGEKPVTVSFRRLVVTDKIDATARTSNSGVVTSASSHLTRTINGSMTVDGQPVTYNNETLSVDSSGF